MAHPDTIAKLKAHLTREWPVPTWLIYAVVINFWATGWLYQHLPGWLAGAIIFASWITFSFVASTVDERKRKRARLEEERREAADELQHQLLGHHQVPGEMYFHERRP